MVLHFRFTPPINLDPGHPFNTGIMQSMRSALEARRTGDGLAFAEVVDRDGGMVWFDPSDVARITFDGPEAPVGFR